MSCNAIIPMLRVHGRVKGRLAGFMVSKGVTASDAKFTACSAMLLPFSVHWSPINVIEILYAPGEIQTFNIHSLFYLLEKSFNRRRGQNTDSRNHCLSWILNIGEEQCD